MSLTVEKIERHVGQSIKDPYGRFSGVIVGFYSEVDGSVTHVEVESPEGKFLKYPAEQLVFEGEQVTLTPNWKAESIDVKKKLDLAKRRAVALDELYSKGEIASHAYDQFKRKLEAEITRLKDELREVKRKLNEKLSELEQQIIELERASAALKMSYLSGEISEKTYKHAIELIKRGLDRCVAEKKDVDTELKELEKLESGPVLPFKRKVEEESEEYVQQQEIPGEEEQPLMVQVVEGSE